MHGKFVDLAVKIGRHSNVRRPSSFWLSEKMEYCFCSRLLSMDSANDSQIFISMGGRILTSYMVRFAGLLDWKKFFFCQSNLAL